MCIVVPSEAIPPAHYERMKRDSFWLEGKPCHLLKQPFKTWTVKIRLEF